MKLLRQLFEDLRGLAGLRHTPYGFRPALLIGVLGFFQLFDSAAFALAGPEFVRHGLKIDSIIAISQLLGLITLFAAIPVGWYADRHRRLPLLGLFNLVSGVFAAGTALRYTTAAVGAARLGDEVTNTGGDVPAFSLLADYYPPDTRGRAFAFLGTLRRLGRIIALPAVAVLLLEFGIEPTFVVAGTAIVVTSVVIMIGLREPVRGYFERLAAGADEDVARTEDEPQSFGEAWRSTFAVRTLRRLFVGDIIVGFTVGVDLFLPFFLTEKYGLGIGGRAMVSMPGAMAALIGGIYGGGLVDRFIRRDPGRVMLVYGAFTAVGVVGVIGYALAPPLWVIVAATMVLSFGAALIGPALSAVYSQVVPPSIRTQGLQLTGLAVIPGLVFGASMAAIIRQLYGYGTMFWSAIPFYLVGAAVFASAGQFFEVDRRNTTAAALATERHRRAAAEGRSKLLVCRDVEVEYDGGVQVLFGLDLEIDEGELVALLGTNGAGKSTLLRAISGTQEASGGAIVFDGRDVTHMPPHEIATRGVVHMPGGKGVFPELSVRENLLLGHWLSDDPQAEKAATADVLALFPALLARAEEPAASLSGGEQQQLSLAQALLMRPKLLLIDELSLGLSPTMVGQLVEVVRRIHERGVTVVVVEQSVNVALTLADRAVFMEKGEVKFDGPTAELLARPDILRAVYVKGTGALTDGVPAAARQERDRRRLEIGTARRILEVQDLTKHFGGVRAVNGVSFGLSDGEVLGLIGPNGSGKTTLFDLISGYQSPDAGAVLLQGVDITALSPEERARRKLIRRFQDAKLFPSLTVFETLLVSLEQRHEVKSTLLAAVGAPQARRSERRLRVRADRLVELLELGAYRDKFVKELSTGLRRIVDLACVLAAEPEVLLLDEPSSGIAQAEAEGLAPLLRRVKFETGCSILIIEHDMPLISAVADELIALEQGEIVTRGAPEEVLNNDRVIEAYLGGSEAAIHRSGSLV